MSLTREFESAKYILNAVGNYGHEWEVGEVKIKTPYKPSSSEEILGKLGLHVALRGINITLKGNSLIPKIL